MESNAICSVKCDESEIRDGSNKMIMKIVIEIECSMKGATEMRAAMQMETCEVTSKI